MSGQTAVAGDDPQAASARALGSSFYAAMRIMPSGQREAMFEIYSFCRAVDDIADDQGHSAAGRLIKLERWKHDIGTVYRGSEPEALRGLATAVRAFKLDREDFVAIINGMEMDVVANIQAPDAATLDLYCDRVASAVGRLSSRVFGLPAEDGKKLAHELGRALQLTNILRDLDEDAAMNRLYLPKEILRDAGISGHDPKEVLAHPALDAACAQIVALARDRFGKADAIMKGYPRRVVRTPGVMSEAYKSILATLVARGFAAPRRPVKLSKPRLGLILIRHFVL